MYGDNLVDAFTNQASAAVTGSGVTLSINSAGASQVVLNYSVATNAGTGNQNVTLSTRFGTSNAAGFNVGDPTPVIASISPGTWSAGTNTQIIIGGHGFGTNPSLTVTGPGVSGSSVVNASDTQIVANVNVAASSPGGTATVQVQSNGYGGNGFASANPGQSPQGSNTASVQPLPTPVPQILFLGSNVSGTTQSVVVGQQIALTVAPPGNGLTVNNRSWSGVNAGAAIAGWTPGQTPQLPNPSNENFTFYWVNAGTSGQATYTVTYRWTLDNGQSNSASVTFHVAGSSEVTVNATQNTVNILQPPNSGSQDAPLLILGTLGQAGITFMASASHLPPNQGAYTWVQLVNSDQIQIISRAGSGMLPSSFAGPPELDLTYPYQVVYTTNLTNDTAKDSPYIPLPPTWGELQRGFSATMYLMWDPTLPTGCISDSTCTSIPVPLGTVSWGWTGDVINTLQPQSYQGVSFPLWILNCERPWKEVFQSSAVYPTWNKVAGSQ